MSPTEREAFGRLVKQGRESLGWRVERFAAELGVSATAVREWESGKKEPRLGHYAGICKLLGWPYGPGDTRVKLRGKALVPQAA